MLKFKSVCLKLKKLKDLWFTMYINYKKETSLWFPYLKKDIKKIENIQ